MAKFYSFPSQVASESCPAIPRGTRVYGESLGDATAKLAKALEKDPELKEAHPEFGNPNDAGAQAKKPSSKKSQ